GEQAEPALAAVEVELDRAVAAEHDAAAVGQRQAARLPRRRLVVGLDPQQGIAPLEAGEAERQGDHHRGGEAPGETVTRPRGEATWRLRFGSTQATLLDRGLAQQPPGAIDLRMDLSPAGRGS